MLGKSLFSQLSHHYVGKILALCWENPCLAPEFHQSHLQCIVESLAKKPQQNGPFPQIDFSFVGHRIFLVSGIQKWHFTTSEEKLGRSPNPIGNRTPLN